MTRDAQPWTAAVTLTRLVRVSYVLNGFAAMLGGAILPKVVTEFRLTPINAGLFLGLPALGVTGAGLASGALADVVGIRRLLALSAAGMAASLMIIASSPAFSVLLVGAITFGIANGLIEMGGNAFIATTDIQNAAPRLNRLHFFFGIGALSSPAIVAILFSGGIDWRNVYCLTAIPLVVLAFAFSREPSLGSTGFRKLDMKSLVRVLRLPSMIRVWISAVLLLAAEQGITGWITTYMRHQSTLLPNVASISLTIFWSAMLAGRLINSCVPARASPRIIIVVEVVCSSLFLWMTLMSRSVMGGLVGLSLLGLFMAGIYSTLMAYAAQLHIASPGLIAGLFVAGVGIGKLIGPTLIGLVAERVGLSAGMSLTIALLLGVALVIGVPFRQSTG